LNFVVILEAIASFLLPGVSLPYLALPGVSLHPVRRSKIRQSGFVTDKDYLD
jgi:hypothetical protein